MPFKLTRFREFGFGLALGLSTLNVFFRDIGQVLGVLLQIWMWSLPIVYVEEMLPEGYRAGLPFNPAYPFVRTLRALYLEAAPPPAWMWGAMLGWGLVVGALGWLLLRRLRPEIRDVL
jgi:ABC-type polysaccharide/polyol phosphate export permease